MTPSGSILNWDVKSRLWAGDIFSGSRKKAGEAVDKSGL
jgi:hypothetical protein